MGRLLAIAGLGMAGYLIHTGHIEIGGSGLRKTTGAIGSYSSAPSPAITGITNAAAKIGN